MCHKVFPTYSACGHNAKKNPDIVITFFDDCKKRDCSGTIENIEEQNGLCPNCNSADTFKHCYFSDACQVEFDHAYTDLPRLLADDDIVLVTPIRERCPSCVEHNYKVHSGDPDRTIDAASSMPLEYQGLSRKSFAHVASSRPSLKASIVPLNMSLADFQKSQRSAPTTHGELETNGATDKAKRNLHRPGHSRYPPPTESNISEILSSVKSECQSHSETFHHGQGKPRASSRCDDHSNMMSQTSSLRLNRHSRGAKQFPNHETSDQSRSGGHKSMREVEILPSSSRSYEDIDACDDNHRIRSHTGLIAAESSRHSLDPGRKLMTRQTIGERHSHHSHDTERGSSSHYREALKTETTQLIPEIIVTPPSFRQNGSRDLTSSVATKNSGDYELSSSRHGNSSASQSQSPTTDKHRRHTSHYTRTGRADMTRDSSQRQDSSRYSESTRRQVNSNLLCRERQ